MNLKRKIAAASMTVLSVFSMISGNSYVCRDVNSIVVSAAEEYDFSSDYIYNVLETDAERIFYDRLYECCRTVQNSTEDYLNAPYAKYSDLIDYERALEIAWLFYYDQPEFFWISSSFKISSTRGVSFGIYAEYTDGEARQTALSDIMSEAQIYIDGAMKCATDYDKVKYLRDELLENVTYKEGEYDQSIASTFLLGETVCAGYTKAYTMLCNAVGIDAVSVTGYIHGWNAIELYDRWYLVDVTNDTSDYDLFLISDETMRNIDIESELIYTVTKVSASGESHTFEAYMHDLDDINFPTYYDDYPSCTVNFSDVLIPITDAQKGDVTCDGKVNLYDAIEIARYIMNMRSFTDDEYTVADYNSDEQVNLYDVIEIARVIMG